MHYFYLSKFNVTYKCIQNNWDFESTIRFCENFWWKDRIRRNFHVFRIERSQITNFAKKRNDDKTRFFEFDFFNEDVKTSIVYFICIASRTATKSRREKMNFVHCEKNTFTTLARKERMRNAMNIRVKEFFSFEE